MLVANTLSLNYKMQVIILLELILFLSMENYSMLNFLMEQLELTSPTALNHIELEMPYKNYSEMMKKLKTLTIGRLADM